MVVVTVHTFILGGRDIFGSSLGLGGPEVADGCLSWVQ